MPKVCRPLFWRGFVKKITDRFVIKLTKTTFLFPGFYSESRMDPLQNNGKGAKISLSDVIRVRMASLYISKVKKERRKWQRKS